MSRGDQDTASYHDEGHFGCGIVLPEAPGDEFSTDDRDHYLQPGCEFEIFASNALSAILLHCEAIRKRAARGDLSAAGINPSIDRIASNVDQLWKAIEASKVTRED